MSDGAATAGTTRRFLKLAGPNVLANLMVPLAGVVDTAVLGHLPEIEHLAGVGLATVIFDYLYWSFGFLRLTLLLPISQEVWSRAQPMILGGHGPLRPRLGHREAL